MLLHHLLLPAWREDMAHVHGQDLIAAGVQELDGCLVAVHVVALPVYDHDGVTRSLE